MTRWQIKYKKLKISFKKWNSPVYSFHYFFKVEHLYLIIVYYAFVSSRPWKLQCFDEVLLFQYKRDTRCSTEEGCRTIPRGYVESLHQNSKSTLLYGKNNVMVQPVRHNSSPLFKNTRPTTDSRPSNIGHLETHDYPSHNH